MSKPEPALAPKDTPYFFDVDIEFATVDSFQYVIEDVSIDIRCQVLDGQVWLAECHYQLTNLFGDIDLVRNRSIQKTLKERLRRKQDYSGAFVEEFTTLLLGKVEPAPDEFINCHASTLVRWLRSLDKPITESEAQEILNSRARYSQRDLTLIDREGAIIIAEKRDFQFDLELLKIGNYQLLRYRRLDREVEKSLQELRRYASRPRPAWLPAKYKTLQKILSPRLALTLDFEKTDQSLLLIGDWYSAQVYRLIVEQFFLNDWKNIAQTKLDGLVAINEIVYQDLAFSWRRLLDLLQLVGWLILLVGYFILFFVNLD
jgi:hypothetical protein